MSAFRLSRDTILITVILFMALAVRLWGIGFGLPDLYHADEQLVVHHALAFGSGDLNPHYFKIPPFVSYLLFFLYGLFFLTAKVLGWVRNVPDFGALFLKDPAAFYLLGRIILGAWFGTLSVFFMYKLISRFFSRPHALLTSLFFAFNFLHVQNSHYIYLDIPLLLIFVLSFFPILSILEYKGTVEYCKFGALAGLAFATKYNGAFIVVPFLLAHALSQGLTWKIVFNRRLLYTALMALISYSVANPYTWLDVKTFFSGLFAMRQHQGMIGFMHHLAYSLNESMGIPLLVMSILGTLVSIFRWERTKLPFAAFVIGYYVVLTQFSQEHDRYVLPLIPFLLFFAADLLLRIQILFRISKLFLGIILTGILLPCLVKVYLSDLIISREDIRSVAARWIEKQIPNGSKAALGEPFFLPRLQPTLEQLKAKKMIAFQQGAGSMQLRRLDWMIARAQRFDKSRYELFFLTDDSLNEFLFANPSAPYDMTLLRELGVEYVIFPKVYPQKRASFYSHLRQQGKLVRTFSPYKKKDRAWPIDYHPLTGTPSLWQELLERERNGHIIEIYKLS